MNCHIRVIYLSFLAAVVCVSLSAVKATTHHKPRTEITTNIGHAKGTKPAVIQLIRDCMH